MRKADGTLSLEEALHVIMDSMKEYFPSALATETERAREHDYGLGLTLIAVNAFRKHIETYGIDQAHALIAEVVVLIKEQTRDMDILARFGATEEEASDKLASLRESVTRKAVGQGDSPVKLTIGALVLQDNRALKQGLQDILAALGKNLVKAKSQKGENIVISPFEV